MTIDFSFCLLWLLHALYTRLLRYHTLVHRMSRLLIDLLNSAICVLATDVLPWPAGLLP